jgi:glycosyltransferase involved in cell wall biosynthesis
MMTAVDASTVEDGLSIVVPAFNEEGSLATIVDALSQLFLRDGFERFEIIVVDDGSTDDTPRIARSLAASNPRVKIVHHAANRGYGGALRSGYATASMTWATSIPADGEVAPAHLLAMWRAKNSADVIVSDRLRPAGTMPLHRAVLTAGWRALMRLAMGVSQEGKEGTYIFRRAMIDGQALRSDSGLLHMEILIRCQMNGAIMARGPSMVVQPRLSGRSKVSNLRTVLWTLWEMLALRLSLARERRRAFGRDAGVAPIADVDGGGSRGSNEPRHRNGVAHRP